MNYKTMPYYLLLLIHIEITSVLIIKISSYYYQLRGHGALDSHTQGVSHATFSLLNKVYIAFLHF